MALSEKVTNMAGFTGENFQILEIADKKLKYIQTKYYTGYRTLITRNEESDSVLFNIVLMYANLFFIAIMLSVLLFDDIATGAEISVFIYFVVSVVVYIIIYLNEVKYNYYRQAELKAALQYNNWTFKLLTIQERINNLFTDPVKQGYMDKLTEALRNSSFEKPSRISPLKDINKEMLRIAQVLVGSNKDYDSLSNEEKADVIVVRTLMEYFKE